jgi:hypothetical protein
MEFENQSGLILYSIGLLEPSAHFLSVFFVESFSALPFPPFNPPTGQWRQDSSLWCVLR